MINKKSGKDWRNAHQNAENKLQKIKNEISLRLQELSIAHPDVVISYQANIEKTPILAEQVQDPNFFVQLDTSIELIFIETIEKALANAHPHQQGDLFPSHKTSENAVRIANPETKDKRDV